MNKAGRDQKIKSIIKLEEKICRCERCASLIKCTSKPSLGKGDIEPQVLLVFECENNNTRDIDWIIALRNSIKNLFNIDRVYHTFMVRCQPKACTRPSNSCFPTNKLLDRNNICILNNKLCDGIPIKPFNEEIINCLTYLLEEIAVLKPDYVILFGPRVSDFVLKSYGIIHPELIEPYYKYESITFLSTVEDKSYELAELEKMAFQIKDN